MIKGNLKSSSMQVILNLQETKENVVQAREKQIKKKEYWWNGNVRAEGASKSILFAVQLMRTWKWGDSGRRTNFVVALVW